MQFPKGNKILQRLLSIDVLLIRDVITEHPLRHVQLSNSMPTAPLDFLLLVLCIALVPINDHEKRREIEEEN